MLLQVVDKQLVVFSVAIMRLRIQMNVLPVRSTKSKSAMGSRYDC